MSNNGTDNGLTDMESALPEQTTDLLASGDEIVEGLAAAMVMMIDDDPITLEVIQEFLTEAGYSNVVALSQPAMALEQMRKTPPDVVLLDLMMPGVSGFDILKAMRAEEELGFVPVIMLTAASDAETKLQALELGATDFLAKPVDPSELSLRLRNTLAFKAYRDRLAYFDSLTNLPNRRSLLSHLRVALGPVKDGGERLAVLHIDLDRFKHINDTLGYRLGDDLLKAVALRLGDALRDCETVRVDALRERLYLARFSGDEFTVLAIGPSDETVVEIVARRLVASLATPFLIGDHELFISASIGIAVAPQDGNDAVTLLKHADIAMHAAKEQGRNTFHSYAGELNARAMERLTLEHGLRRAVERNELLLYYQPQIEVASGRIVGVEALMRWRHPELGMIPPARFIPLAEEIDLIHELGDWALFEACRQAVAWDVAGMPAVTVSVNVAAPQFRRAGFPDIVRRALESSGLDPARLMLELTESMLMQQTEQVVDLLGQIRALGVGLSLDDFGTGYSSFSYLKRLPLNEIKIDRAFVTDMASDPQSAAIVAAILALAEGLNMKVVAEGVETEAQLAQLAAHACEIYQGFFYSPPVPPEAILKLFADSR
jgi:diguanylate cyclase (GGDEF)-like protein